MSRRGDMAEATLKRLEVIQRSWAEHGQWSLQLEADLAEELKVGRRQIRTDREVLERMIRTGMDPKEREIRRAEVVAAGWATYRKASDKEQHGPAVRALDLIARVTGMAGPVDVPPEDLVGLAPVVFPVPLPHYDPDAPTDEAPTA